MRKTIIAVYDNTATAEQVVNDLVNAGIDRSNIGFAVNNPAARGAKTGNDAYTGDVSAAEGAGFGAVIGGLTGLLIGLGALAIPGIGPIIAAGPLAAALTGLTVGMGAGAITGGLVGGLVDLGVPEDEAGMYAEAVRRGGALVSATVHSDRLETATQIMRQHGPLDMEQRTTQWRADGWQHFNPNIDPYTAEELASERQRSSGVTGIMSTGSQYTPRSYGTVTGYDQWHEDFYTHYNQNYATRGYDYLVMMPAYRQGYYMGADEKYRNRTWDQIEADARSAWERSYANTAWDDIKGAVRYAWEKVKDAVGAE
jgi:hypothetical protein